MAAKQPQQATPAPIYCQYPECDEEKQDVVDGGFCATHTILRKDGKVFRDRARKHYNAFIEQCLDEIDAFPDNSTGKKEEVWQYAWVLRMLNRTAAFKSPYDEPPKEEAPEPASKLDELAQEAKAQDAEAPKPSTRSPQDLQREIDELKQEVYQLTAKNKCKDILIDDFNQPYLKRKLAKIAWPEKEECEIVDARVASRDVRQKAAESLKATADRLGIANGLGDVNGDIERILQGG